MTSYVEHYEKRDYIYPLSRNEIYFKLRTNIKDIRIIHFVYYEKIRKKPEISIKMNNFNTKGSSPFYVGILKYKETIKYIDYYFEIITNRETFYYSPEGLRIVKPIRSFCYSDTNYYDVFRTPNWAQGLIGYEIFPDRFNIGNQVFISNQSKWNDIPTRKNFFGGNIRGIIDKIEYLKSMSIGILYLTPIFKAKSNHKYDTIDYFDIDPGFGSKDDFKVLVDSLHEANIRIIIDGVFNHIGFYSPQFQDVLKYGINSRYYNWFYIYGETIDKENINYECVGYHKWMPKLRYETKDVREYIKSVGRYWMKYFNIDGFRLDVSDEVDFTFWHEFRSTVKSIKSDALLIGETWKNGSDLLGPNALDSVMNYRLRDTLLDFFLTSRINIEEFKNRIESIYFDYPKQSHNVLYNLLGSHDTNRIITLFEDNPLKVYLLVSILFALPGIPFIYYGDEIGTTGGNDPLSRKTMDWIKIHNEIHIFYLSIIKERISSDVLKYGDFKHIDIEKDIYSFIRSYHNQQVVFLANTTDKKKEVTFSYHGETKNITLLPYKSELINMNVKFD